MARVRGVCGAMVAVGALVVPTVTAAAGLLDVYRLAEAQDPQYAAALDELAARRTLNDQARGVLLPQVELVGEALQTWQDVESEEIELGGAGGIQIQPPLDRFVTLPPVQTLEQSGNVDVVNWNYGVQLRQPLFNKEAFERFSQAKQQVALAEVQFAIARQDLILRTSQAYFNVLLAERQLETVRAEKDAIEQQLAQARRRFEVGTASINDINEAQSRYDLAVAREIELSNQLAISRRQLRAITGEPVDELAELPQGVPLVGPDPAAVEAWTARGRDNSLLRIARDIGVDVARQEIAARRGRLWPTLAATAGYTVAEQTSPSFGGDPVTVDTEIGTVGVQLSWPLFQGGLVRAQAAEAAALYQQSRDQLVDAVRQAELQSSQAYLQLTSSIAQAGALRQALLSSQTAQRSTEVGRDVGVRTNVDVLNSVQQVYAAERDVETARYNYLLNRLNLQAAVGGLEVGDVAAIDQMLTEAQRANAAAQAP